jgi:hypothetical protein
MANEFVAKNGLISQNNTTISGSLIQGLAGNIATGDYSHAEGSITKAVGNYSHAEGDFTQAKGDYSHAEGQETIASGSYSHAEGYQTIALANHQHVQGQWNTTSLVQSAFIVGNGTDDNNRSNLIYAHDSTVEITGSLLVSAPSDIPLQIKGGTGTLLSVSSSTTEIFKISDTFSPNLFTVSTGSTAVFNIDNTNKVIISGSLVVTGGITGSFSGSVFGYVPNTATASFIRNTQTGSFILNSQTSSMSVLSSSFATTASYINPTFISASAAAAGFGSGGGGGITSISAGAGITVNGGVGPVTSGGVTIANTAGASGVTSITAGDGIFVNQTNGDVVITNTGGSGGISQGKVVAIATGISNLF